MLQEVASNVQRSVQVPRDKLCLLDAPQRTSQRPERTRKPHRDELQNVVVVVVDLRRSELRDHQRIEPRSAFFIRSARWDRCFVPPSRRELGAAVGDGDFAPGRDRLERLLDVVEKASENPLLATVETQALPRPPGASVLVPKLLGVGEEDHKVLGVALQVTSLDRNRGKGVDVGLDSAVPFLRVPPRTDDPRVVVVLVPRQNEGLDLAVGEGSRHVEDVDATWIQPDDELVL